jgi:tetratricopeptide (TPR) repeat protein
VAEIEGVTQWIEAARSTGDVETALARAKAIRRKAPKERAGYTYAISVLLAQNRLEEAAELNEAGHGAVPDGLGPDYDGTLAQIAERRNDWKKASEIWLAAIEKAPRLPHLHLAAIRATRASGDQAAADTLLTRAFAMFSYDNSIKAEHDHRFPDVAGSADTGRTAAS